jgi:hypothetical protein
MNAAAGTSSSQPAIMSYKDAVASNQHQKARSINVSKSSKTPVGSIQKPSAVNAIAEVHTTAKIDSASLTTSLGNPTEDSFITVAKKKRAVGVVNNSEKNKIWRKLRTPMHGVHNSSSLPVVSIMAKTNALFI